MEWLMASFPYIVKQLHKLYNTFNKQNKAKESTPLIPYLKPHLVPLMAP